VNAVPYTCHKCGSTIEEGTAFCPHCGAPQIRVALPEPEAPSFAPGTPAEMQPPAEPVPLTALPLAHSDGAVQWRRAIVPILIGGFSIVVGSIIPISIFWKLLIIAGGASVAARVYRSRSPMATMTGTVGAKLGAATALFSFAVVALVLIVGCLIDSAGIRQQFTAQFQQMQAQITDPNVLANTQQIVQKINTPEGFAAFITASLALSFFVFLAFGLAGGAITGVLMRRGDHQH
jgi:zinc-ribbon domain